MLSHDLLNILACPSCKGKLTLLDVDKGLLCSLCGLKFPIREEIPVMLLDEAETVTPCVNGGAAE
jgi:uncharacterized protein